MDPPEIFIVRKAGRAHRARNAGGCNTRSSPDCRTRQDIGAMSARAGVREVSSSRSNCQHTFKCCFEKVRFVRGALEANISIGANEDQPAVAWSVAFREGF